MLVSSVCIFAIWQCVSNRWCKNNSGCHVQKLSPYFGHIHGSQICECEQQSHNHKITYPDAWGQDQASLFPYWMLVSQGWQRWVPPVRPEQTNPPLRWPWLSLSVTSEVKWNCTSGWFSCTTLRTRQIPLKTRLPSMSVVRSRLLLLFKFIKSLGICTAQPTGFVQVYRFVITRCSIFVQQSVLYYLKLKRTNRTNDFASSFLTSKQLCKTPSSINWSRPLLSCLVFRGLYCWRTWIAQVKAGNAFKM